MKISDLPPALKSLATRRALEGVYDSEHISFAFHWDKTPEGYQFWHEVNNNVDIESKERSIDEDMVINDLPPKLKALAILRTKEHGDIPSTIAESFRWSETPEGSTFWYQVNSDIGIKEKEDNL